MPKITVEGLEYNTEDLSEDALNSLKHVKQINQIINEIQAKINCYKFASDMYAGQLKRVLEEND